jgi:hypothetical protein
MAGTSWEKSPPELVAAFEALVDRRPDVVARKMFGYPAGFVGGHLATCLHEHRWIVRLPDDARAELLREPGAAQFEPMPGRPMQEYVVLPPGGLRDPPALDGRVSRAVARVRTLPAKG